METCGPDGVSGPEASRSVLRISGSLDVFLSLRPGRGYPGEDIDDLRIGYLLPERGHAAVDRADPSAGQGLRATKFRVLEEHGSRMVPGVARLVMGRRGIDTVRARALPVGLAFEVGAVAGGAMLLVKQCPLRQIGAVECVVGKGGSGQKGQHRHRYAPHATSTQVFMPEA